MRQRKKAHHTCRRNQVMTACMTDPRECVVLGVEVDASPAGAAGGFNSRREAVCLLGDCDCGRTVERF